jgi:hypothetical protein
VKKTSPPGLGSTTASCSWRVVGVAKRVARRCFDRSFFEVVTAADRAGSFRRGCWSHSAPSVTAPGKVISHIRENGVRLNNSTTLV